MPTFKKADDTVKDIAASVIKQYECYEPLREYGVKIDWMLAYPTYNDETGEAVGDALRHQGRKALGITRKVSLKDRAKGLGDVEICIDGDWWQSVCDEERAALIDHELYHIVASAKKDDLGRPIIRLRKHDVEFGWFSAVAARHGKHSIECQHAKVLMDEFGQCFWPNITAVEENEETSRFSKIEVHQAA